MNPNQPDNHAISVLVVGCEANMLHLLGDVLSEAGFVVTTLHRDDAIEDGLELVQPMAVVCDEQVRLFDGERLYDELCRSRRWAGIPFILLSDRCDAVRVARCLDWGMEDYIAKPFEIDEFHARIRKAVRHRMRSLLHGGGEVAFSGKLEFLELPDLIINLHQNSRTGELTIHDTEGQYRLLFAAGELASASGPADITGRKALFRAIRRATGVFSFVPREQVNATEPASGEFGSPTNLVLSSVQECDEFPMLRRQLPNGRVVLAPGIWLEGREVPAVVRPLIEHRRRPWTIDSLIDVWPGTDLEAAQQLLEAFRKEYVVAYDFQRTV